MRRSKAPASPGAPWELETGFTGSADTVAVYDCTIVLQTPSNWTAHVVDLLFEVFELDPVCAIAWACIIQAHFPWFREV